MKDNDFFAVKSIRELFPAEAIRQMITPETELRYIKTFISKFEETWAEICLFHKENARHFPEFEQFEDDEGNIWLASDNGWD